MESMKKRKKRSTIVAIGDIEYISLNGLFKELGKDITLKTFKGILEAMGISPAYLSGSTHLYNRAYVKDIFTKNKYHGNTD